MERVGHFLSLGWDQKGRTPQILVWHYLSGFSCNSCVLECAWMGQYMHGVLENCVWKSGYTLLFCTDKWSQLQHRSFTTHRSVTAQRQACINPCLNRLKPVYSLDHTMHISSLVQASLLIFQQQNIVVFVAIEVTACLCHVPGISWCAQDHWTSQVQSTCETWSYKITPVFMIIQNRWRADITFIFLFCQR